MKKVISITIGGMVFAIENDAYEVLAAYLEDIKKHLSGSSDYTEIAEDIERAVAEKFIAQKRDEKHAITGVDVDLVIKEMGTPADFTAEDSEDNDSQTGAGTKTEAKDAGSDIKKRFYRDGEDRIAGGVAAGLAKYFDIDPVIVRLVFVVSVFFNGLGLLAYIILWLVIPAAETTAQKYAMRGEKVTLNQITGRVKKKLDEVDTERVSSGVRHGWLGVQSVLTKLFEIIGTVIRSILKILRYIVGFVFVIAGALAIATLVFASSVLWLVGDNDEQSELQPIADILLADMSGYVLLASVFVILLIPLIVIILAGSSFLTGQNKFSISKSITLGIAWVVAVALVGAIGVLNGSSLVKAFRALEISQYEIGDQMHISIGDIADLEDAAYYFECPEGEYFKISYSDESNVATLVLEEDMAYILNRAISGSGARYVSADGNYVFWEHQGEARIEIGGETLYEGCVLRDNEMPKNDDAMTGDSKNICTPAQKEAEACTLEYAPVCGLVEVQCITAPCDPVPETFGNACAACAQENVISYTEGQCALE